MRTIPSPVTTAATITRPAISFTTYLESPRVQCVEYPNPSIWELMPGLDLTGQAAEFPKARIRGSNALTRRKFALTISQSFQPPQPYDRPNHLALPHRREAGRGGMGVVYRAEDPHPSPPSFSTM